MRQIARDGWQALVTAQELAEHLRLDDWAAEQAYLERLADAAAAYVETRSGVGVVQCRRTYEVQRHGLRVQVIPYGPVVVDDDENTAEMVAIATDGTEAAVPITQLGAVKRGFLAEADLNGDADWWRLTVSAGHGTPPMEAVQAVLLIAAHWYEHREAVTDANALSAAPDSADALIWLLRGRG